MSNLQYITHREIEKFTAGYTIVSYDKYREYVSLSECHEISDTINYLNMLTVGYYNDKKRYFWMNNAHLVWIGNLLLICYHAQIVDRIEELTNI